MAEIEEHTERNSVWQPRLTDYILHNVGMDAFLLAE